MWHVFTLVVYGEGGAPVWIQYSTLRKGRQPSRMERQSRVHIPKKEINFWSIGVRAQKFSVWINNWFMKLNFLSFLKEDKWCDLNLHTIDSSEIKRWRGDSLIIFNQVFVPQTLRVGPKTLSAVTDPGFFRWGTNPKLGALTYYLLKSALTLKNLDPGG